MAQVAVPDFSKCKSIADCDALASKAGFLLNYKIDCKAGKIFRVVHVDPPTGTLKEIASSITITRTATPEDNIKLDEGPFHVDVSICDLQNINREVFPKFPPKLPSKLPPKLP
jgi:hypothetical protein